MRPPSAVRSPANTLPAITNACALSRDSAKPRSTSSVSTRIFEGFAILGGGHGQAVWPGHIAPGSSAGRRLHDLIEAKRKDLLKTFKTDDFYFLSLCDRLTGYSLFRKMNNKQAKTTADTIEPLLAEMARILGAPIVQINMDKGKEYHGSFKAMLTRKGIKQKFVNRANRVETQNRIFQRNFYRLYALRRGNITSLTRQAQDITNNTWSKHIGMTPEEAAKADVADLVPRFNAAREQSDTSYRKKPIKTGSTVRYLVKPRKLVRTLAYKSYRGKHWSSKVHKVDDVKKVGQANRYRVHGRWFDVDELLVCGTDDPVVEAEISKRKADQDKKHSVWK